MRHVVKSASPQDLRKTGLGLAFFDVVQRCLNFHELPLLRVTYPCLFELIEVLETSQSVESVKRYEDLLLPLLKELEFEEKEVFRNVRANIVCLAWTFQIFPVMQY